MTISESAPPPLAVAASLGKRLFWRETGEPVKLDLFFKHHRRSLRHTALTAVETTRTDREELTGLSDVILITEEECDLTCARHRMRCGHCKVCCRTTRLKIVARGADKEDTAEREG